MAAVNSALATVIDLNVLKMNERKVDEKIEDKATQTSMSPDRMDRLVSNATMLMKKMMWSLSTENVMRKIAARLIEIVPKDFRIRKKAVNPGMCQNRCPSVQCDIKPYTHTPRLEEVVYMPSDNYIHAKDLLKHSCMGL
ncbi:hypothetical protein B0J11DRAFT_509267 [Dendryphion nanum]|uniref:Uncharacterized protein n=1 Tax=Dendryphion nanum TaxID=256645 RepID=A0A9P9DE19_9PLEO|nr:hypothetical protein B0J11DRAFT_509267 [Dendryphion nanum]